MVAQVRYSVVGRSRGPVTLCVVYTVHVETRKAGFLVSPQNQGGGGFFDLSLKTASYGLVIWTSKSPRRFFSLGLKTKQATVCRLRHKTNGRATTWDTRRNLADYFTWKQDRLTFPSLASRLAKAGQREVHAAPSGRLRWSQVEDERVDAMGCVGLCYPCYVVFILLGPRGNVII
jgi:hypothetical protein